MSNESLSSKDAKSDMVTALRELQSEYSLLSELRELEHEHTQRLIAMMRVLQSGINEPIAFNKERVAGLFQNVKQAYLVWDGVVMALDPSGNLVSKPLHEFDPEIVLSILRDCAPELRRKVSEKRQEVAARVQLLEKMAKELKKSEAILKLSDDWETSETSESDIVRSSIAREQGE